MGITSFTVDQDTAMALRQVKQEVSRTAGRVVPMWAVLRILEASWRASIERPGEPPCRTPALHRTARCACTTWAPRHPWAGPGSHPMASPSAGGTA